MRGIPLIGLVLLAALVHGKSAPVAKQLVPTTPPHRNPADIRADLSRWVDYPLVKTKFAAYNSGWVPGQLRTYRRDAHLLDEVRPDALRIDGVLGSPRGILFSNPPIISGAPPALRYDFRQVDDLIALLGAHNVPMYWCYSYVSESFGATFQDPPADLSAWGAMVGQIARHFRQSGRPVAYHEIYNEPDNRDFFHGTVKDYLRLYASAAKAIRSADPDAAIGGPALAFTDSWVEPFLDHVVRARLPLDFLSFHYYPGVPYRSRNVRDLVQTMGAALAHHPELAATEMHLNEYNALPIDYPENGPQQKHRLAALLLRDFAYFVTQPRLTKVHWAQFMDTGGGNWSGLVSIDGHRKAAFNAWRIYARMPVDRRQVTLLGPPGIGAMASADGRRASLVAWNLTGAEQQVRLQMDRIPFNRGALRVFRIDADHASWGDNPAKEDLTPVETRAGTDLGGVKWQGAIPDGGVLYLEADRGSAPRPTPVPARVERILHCFPNGSTGAYADFDRNTWIARLGMAGEQTGEAIVGVQASGLLSVLVAEVTTHGIRGARALAGVLTLSVDYRVAGRYVRSVLYQHGAHPRPRIPDLRWGTKARPGVVVRWPGPSHLRLDVARYAPPGWHGDAIITFRMANTGPDSRTRIVIRAPRP